jgi:hypothetical protein
MEIVLFSIFMVLLGIFIIWASIFGKKKEIKEAGIGIPTDFTDFFIMIIYRLFPSIIRRLFLFLLGVGIIVGAICLLVLK